MFLGTTLHTDVLYDLLALAREANNAGKAGKEPAADKWIRRVFEAVVNIQGPEKKPGGDAFIRAVYETVERAFFAGVTDRPFDLALVEMQVRRELGQLSQLSQP